MQIGSWSWSALTGELHLTSPEMPAIDGVWTLPALAQVLDGLSTSRLQTAFARRPNTPSDPVVNCALALSRGSRVQLVGGFITDAEARGVVLNAQTLPADTVIDLEDLPAPGTLTPVAQAILSAKTRDVVGYELLARWDGEQGPDPRWFESPSLGAQMLDAAVALAQRLASTPLFVSVNLSGADLSREGVVDRLIARVSEAGLLSGSLQVELTEQSALAHPMRLADGFARMREAGVGIVLDDFGAGHSGFLWLTDLPLDGLKVDAELVSRLGTIRGRAILASISALARRLGLTVTAEGVETDRQADVLAGLGFDCLQGFVFDRPGPIEGL